MRTISTKQQPLTSLKLASSITLDIVNRVYNYFIYLVEQFSGIQNRYSSRYLWLLSGSVMIGSSIGLMHVIPQESWSIQLTDVLLTVLLLGLAPTLLLWKRVTNATGKPLTNSGESAEKTQIESHRRLEKQSRVLMALARPQMIKGGNFQAVVQPIIAVAADALEVERVSVWLYKKDRSQLECVEVYEQSATNQLQQSEPEEEKTRAIVHSPDHRVSPEGRPASPTRPLTPSPHHPKPLAIANRLDAPIWLNEKIVGVVCYEQLKSTASKWTPEDETFAGAIANLIALTLTLREQQSYSLSVSDGYASDDSIETERHDNRSSRTAISSVPGGYAYTQATPSALNQREEVQWEAVVSPPLRHRHPALQSLSESEARYQLLAHNSTDLISRYTPEGIFLSASSACCTLLGYTAAQLVGQSTYEFCHPQDLATLRQFHSNLLNQQQTKPISYRIRHQNGDYIWLETSTYPIYHPSTGVLEEIIAVSRDITQRKQTEKALRESERQLQKLTANVPGILYECLLRTDGSLSFLFVSSGVHEICGLEPAQILQDPQILLNLIHADERFSFKRSLAISAETLQIWKWEGRILLASSKIKWIQATARPDLQANGDILWDGMVIDISERKQTEARLYKVNRDQSNIFESLTEAFFAVDHQWQFTYINSKTEEFLSRKAEELLGKRVWDEFPHALGSQFEVQCRRAVAEQVSVKFEEFYSPLQIWLLVRAYPYEAGLSVYFSDITERKQAEAGLLERSRLSTLAAEVGVALVNGGALLTILQHCTEAMVQQLHAASATLWTLNPVSQKLEQKAASGQHFPLQPDLIDLVAQTRQPYWIPQENGQQGRTGEQESERAQEWESGRLSPSNSLTPLPAPYFSGYPLIVEDRLMGVMTVLGNQPLSEEARNTLSWVANAITVAIDRYWARSELLTRRESLLFGLANQIRNSLELDTILQTAVQSIRNLFQIDRCHFLWHVPHESKPYWEIVNEARNPKLPSHIGQYTTRQVKLSAQRLLNRQIIQIDQVETLRNPRLRKFLVKMGYTSVLSIPMKTHGGAIGVISCGHCTGSRPWDESEVELLQAVVAQLAIALDQAELYAQARQTASDAQAQAQQLEQTLRQLRTTQAQLVQSEKMSSLGQLVAGVAHEINNPVNFIHGNLAYAGAYIYDLLNLLRLYKEHYPNPAPTIAEQAEVMNIDFIATDLPKLLGSMQRGTDRIRSIVQSLRNFSRLDEAHMKHVDVHEGIESTLMILQHRLKGKGKQPEIIVYKEYGNLPAIECYPGELNQVFMNILINAIEALKPADIGIQEHASLLVSNPSPAITIRTRLLECCESRHSTDTSLALLRGDQRNTKTGTKVLPQSSTQRIVIQIADNGPGMTESVKSRLFDPFFTTKPVGQGSGLGLSISYQIIVEHHHGILTCTSVPGKGTEFWIEIPIQQSS